MPVLLVKNGDEDDIGLPRKAKDPSFMQDLARISEPFGMKIVPTDQDSFICEWR
ncbi:MAG: hypothetical protein J5662_09190 [Clostridia bacterium]|nr:hypothetical protein [Clostridia bacterium]